MGLCSVYCETVVWAYAWFTGEMLHVVRALGLMLKCCINFYRLMVDLLWKCCICCMCSVYCEMLYQLVWAYARFTVDMYGLMLVVW